MMRARMAVATLFVVAAACEEDGAGPNLNDIPGYAISSVRVFPNEATIFVPDTIRASDRITFAAVAIGKSGGLLTGISFVWSSSDESIAIVDSGGTVTPVRTGTVKISASAHKIGSATLVILPATQTVSVSPELDSIFVDEPIVASRDFQQLTATATDVFGEPLTGVSFTWQSAANNVASVDFAGMVRASSLGTANISASANGATAVASIRVVPLVASVSMTPAPAQVLALDTLQLVALARDYSNAAMSRTFNWSSSNPSVATVDANGSVKFLSTGSATITARTAHRTTSTSITALDRVLTSIDVGDGFTCGITNLGRGYCWGLSDVGQTGATPDSTCFADLGEQQPCILPPKRMNRPELQFTSISAGGSFACGIASDQHLYCWGDDEFGQIGNGSTGAGETPSLATVKSERFAMVSAGSNHACALNLTGRAFCWGNDERGQLGDNRTINSTTPIPIADSTLTFTMISAGDRHTCGVTTNGNAYCWGEGNNGQLGNGAGVASSIPVLVGGIAFTSVSAGRLHTCGVSTSGTVHCWGANSLGQLGNGGSSPQLSPITVPGLAGVSAISAGDDHTCAIAGGAVRCWGSSSWGQVGDGNASPHTVFAPVLVPGIEAATISAGVEHTCAMSTAGQAMCWGSNRWGALGNEFQAAIRATPQVVARPR
ncbi:MAG TPA: Ig-like domain-containing protein [Gemmatimonadaceae bacterium]